MQDLTPRAAASGGADAGGAGGRARAVSAGRRGGTTGRSSTPRRGRARSSAASSSSRRSASTARRRCGLLAYVDKETLQIRKFEGNPVHPGSRGRNCAKGPATLNQINDPERILYPLQRVGRARRGQVGARDLGRGARRPRAGASARRWSRAGRTKSCTTSGGRATS